MDWSATLFINKTERYDKNWKNGTFDVFQTRKKIEWKTKSRYLDDVIYLMMMTTMNMMSNKKSRSMEKKL